VRFDPLPLLIAQPKQVPAHDPNPLPKTNQDRSRKARIVNQRFFGTGLGLAEAALIEMR
jgi:hypothetical protein